MDIVKLHATGSTNEALRSRFRESELPHFTCLYALAQSEGKGQQQAQWESEPYKNLTFSILITETKDYSHPFELNQIVAVSLAEWLESRLKIQARIKWPNDILSVRHKLAGILVENFFSGLNHTHSIVGIGLNVNQTHFQYAPKAISLSLLTGNSFVLEELLISFLEHLKRNLERPKEVKNLYHQYMFKYLQFTQFEDADGGFEAKVLGTDEQGQLLLEREGKIQRYDLKSLRWLY
ncbi:biotin--[acetyl-CoA-carboxylase] ligase [Nonlabens xiamenensis]|uniref:biotin--[acetyl-CoA-carboxylase] ligase n=1 Tax=Nonlabens xiamenensis TaxID=2341043 RepID=UPI000F60B23D|nr:biotin--[acetyl-CoA-carboxylase] ligase [Nonlabens xiamenensis]